MKKSLFIALGLSLVSLSAAQNSDLTPSGVSIRGGIGFPSDSALRNGDRALIGLGADLYFSTSVIKSAGLSTYMSFDWLGRSQSGTTVNVFSILANVKLKPQNYGPDALETPFYFFGGLGIAFVEAGNVRSKGALGGRVGVGYDFGSKIFAEASYMMTSGSNGIRGNALGFYIGYRF